MLLLFLFLFSFSVSFKFFFSLQQIQEKQAKKLFSDYKVMTKERCKEGEEWDKNHKKEINELPFAVAEAAKELCCSILRYEKSKGKMHISNAMLLSKIFRSLFI